MSGSHQVFAGGAAVAGGAEASQPLLVQEDAQRITGSHQHVDAQVELETVDDKRLRGHKDRGQISEQSSPSNSKLRQHPHKAHEITIQERLDVCQSLMCVS